ncbi:ATP-dependent permease MDL2 [Delitschia confertaspora ATCC 74209]|uniref:ATP-dependent permease MDL2 n=1 Tax=Delitschia confertaspora ATCC 74209 TaxID=1513339 RepID=A0A9P4JLX3_9PLEO|nr:ATP-dependent permease MDL2 [Delitschia confertaspora ATCC 74209]
MRGTLSFPGKAWHSPGNGALFSRIQPRNSPLSLATRSLSSKPSSLTSIRPSGIRNAFLQSSPLRDSTAPILLRPTLPTYRVFCASRVLSEQQQQRTLAPAKPRKSYKDEIEEQGIPNLEEMDGEEPGFAKSEKATQAAHVNLSAKLSKEGAPGSKPGSMKEMWRLIKIAAPEKKPLAWAFLFLLVSSAVSMSVPFSIGKILDVATQQEGASDTMFGMDVTTFYLALAGVLATGAVANFGRIIILRIVGERIVARLRSKLYRKTFIQNAEFFDANRVGDLISRLGSDTIIVGKSITQNLSDGLRSAVSGAAGFAMMGYVSLKLTGILALVGPPVAVAAFISGRMLRNISRKIQKSLGSLTKVAEERLGNVRTSQAFTGEIQETARYNRQIKKIFELGKKEAMVAASFYGSTGLMGNLTVIAVLYVGGSMVKSGAITIGELSSFLMYTAYAGSSMVGLSSFWGEMMKGVGAASRLFELQDRNPTISPTKGESVKSAQGPLEFKNVSFSYPTRPAVAIFKDLNFRIEEGMNVAIVAPSGAGKSTVASLLLRFYNPTSGTITIDGRDITKMNAKQLRRKIGYVGQEPVLFSGTIAENIAYGVPQATKAEIVTAARKANCNFISDFPDGLETHVGARGTQLSGGQKQRIAIARALIKQPDILILDEATSALDAESETLVNQALAVLLKEKNTTISIAHRLSTIKRSDRIICIGADGQVAEEGTYQELASRPEGAFSKLMEWQLSGGDEVNSARYDPRPTEEEEIEEDLEHEDEEDEENMMRDAGDGHSVTTPSTPSTPIRR